MNKNINKITMIIIVVIVILSIITFIIVEGIKLLTNEEESYIINFEENLIEENIITNYSEYYTIKYIIEDIITWMHDDKYDELYDVINKDIKGDKSKSVYIEDLKDLYTNNFKYEYSNEDGSLTGYNKEENLKLLYNIEDNIYMANVYTLNGEINIGLKLSKNKYEIIYLNLGGDLHD